MVSFYAECELVFHVFRGFDAFIANYSKLILSRKTYLNRNHIVNFRCVLPANGLQRILFNNIPTMVHIIVYAVQQDVPTKKFPLNSTNKKNKI